MKDTIMEELEFNCNENCGGWDTELKTPHHEYCTVCTLYQGSQEELEDIVTSF